MAGLYIHIPFCRKVCYYCDFHFTVSIKFKDRLLKALNTELAARSGETSGLPLDTLYVGGGTPSVLTIEEIVDLFNTIKRYYPINSSPEITFEANPDDLTKEYLSNLKNYTTINRLSIGIQSFIDRDLTILNRRHSANEAIQSVNRAKDAGFTNLNIDLIYGIPGMANAEWQKNLETFGKLDIPHLSAYHLSIEPKTVFGYYQKKGRIKAIDEESSLKQFEMLLDYTENKGYDHYEISNFARPGFYSKHNLGYWTGKPYIGAGPSAHSFLNSQRRWNISNNTEYCNSLEQGRNDYFETEDIDLKKAYNEYLLTSLRTKWGIDLNFITSTFSTEYTMQCEKAAKNFIGQGKLIRENTRIRLSKTGILISDFIIQELMII